MLLEDLKNHSLEILKQPITLLIFVLTFISLMMLYSAANGSFYPWAWKQSLHFLVGICGLIFVASVESRYWLRHAYTLYGVSLFLLILVEVMGYVGMGAQRWLHIASFNLQPSELMRITLVLALARFLSTPSINTWHLYIIPFVLVLLPVGLVLRQPDLGTAVLLVITAVGVCYSSGLSGYVLGGGVLAAAGSFPFLWKMLHPYQQKRILIFWDPDLDPLKAGYHVTQSKIALGSGGLFGKGFLQGSQSHLNFLPEKQTDFIFTMLSEEFGFVGAVVLIILYIMLYLMNLRLAINAKTPFGRFVGIGFATTLFVYIFVNIAMVTGLLPVVGIPLPYMSYGGTAMVTLLLSQGLIFSVCCNYKHREKKW